MKKSLKAELEKLGKKMTLELVKCPHCGYQYRTDMEKIVEDGETVAVRLGFSDVKKYIQEKNC